MVRPEHQFWSGNVPTKPNANIDNVNFMPIFIPRYLSRTMLSPAHVVPDIDDLPEDDGNEKKNKEERQKEFERKLNNLDGDFMKRDREYHVPRIGALPSIRRLGFDAREINPKRTAGQASLV